jgi:hypothetical protein
MPSSPLASDDVHPAERWVKSIDEHVELGVRSRDPEPRVACAVRVMPTYGARIEHEVVSALCCAYRELDVLRPRESDIEHPG